MFFLNIFNIISVILWWSVLHVEETGVPVTYSKWLPNFIT